MGGLCLALCAIAAVQTPGCCLVRPPDARTLIEAGSGGWRTPERAFETFRVAFGADLPDLEYKTLSDRFRREQGALSYQTYRVARQELIERKPYLAFLANAEVVDSRALEEGRHRLSVQAAGRRFEVELVREDEFLIYAGEVSIAGGRLDFGRAVRLHDGRVLRVEIPLEGASEGLPDLSELSGVRVEQVWRIDSFGDELAP